MIENFITASITDYCNFRCFDCPMARYRRSEKHTSTENLDAGKFEQVLLDCFSPADTAIEITGGEPTLVDKFHELMEMLSRRGFPTTVPVRQVEDLERGQVRWRRESEGGNQRICRESR